VGEVHPKWKIEGVHRDKTRAWMRKETQRVRAQEPEPDRSRM
jgi:hypothetical protein